jgi:hypothetical protein
MDSKRLQFHLKSELRAISSKAKVDWKFFDWRNFLGLRSNEESHKNFQLILSKIKVQKIDKTFFWQLRTLWIFFLINWLTSENWSRVGHRFIFFYKPVDFVCAFRLGSSLLKTLTRSQFHQRACKMWMKLTPGLDWFTNHYATWALW